MRTIESAGVEINELDLSFNTELPVGTTSLVVGYARQGPTDELLNVTSIDELERIYGNPETSAERYMYQTARQVLNANGNLLVTRLPYGSADGVGYTTKYSALVYPYIPVDVVNAKTTYAANITANNVTDEASFVTQTSGTEYTSVATNLTSVAGLPFVNAIGSQALSAAVTFYDTGLSANVDTDFVFNTDGSVVIAASANIDLSSSTTLSGGNWTGFATKVPVTSASIYAGEAGPAEIYTFTISGDSTVAPFVSATLTTDIVSYTGLTGSIAGVTDDATHYFLGQPIHISIDDDTYFNWLQGGINWKSTIDANVSGLVDTTDEATILNNIGYGALIVVNEAKTTISDQFEGYYIAIADNSKMDKGSNFDSLRYLKSFNTASEENEWVALNSSSLAFSMTGSYYEHSGSVSEIVESIPDFDFSNSGRGGFGDSVVLALFKVRPTLYNQDTRVLDKVLYESYLGSLDQTRQIQNQAGGSPINFFLEDIVNKQSTGMKVFVNPYISRYSGQWVDSQTQEPTKFVRVVCDERSILGSTSVDVIGTVPAEPHATAKVIFDAINTSFGDYCVAADSLYGVGEAVPCNAISQKAIGSLPRKLEKALRLAENNEQLRIDLIPEAGLGTIWTGVNLDMNNWAAGTTSRDGTRIRDIFDDTVYVDGILNAHTFDADSAGLLSQETGSASEASDLYETIANIFIQFAQLTRKDCLAILDPLRYIFVQGSGEVKVMDNKKLNFSQHIFWPLKNLFGGINTSYACTYANWFKINDSVSDRFVWAPPSGYAANLMIRTDTNFYPWYAPAGLTRGVQTGILDIGINPSQKQRDLLYKNGINPTIYWPGDGYVVWGQKTLQRKPSAFDRINVRRLFLWAEKAVLPVARYFVFEQNTGFTRNRLKAAIQPILGFARSNEGIYDYMIVCDERNNPPEVIDRNELVMDIYIKPVRVAEYILINFVATRTGQKFDELI